MPRTAPAAQPAFSGLERGALALVMLGWVAAMTRFSLRAPTDFSEICIQRMYSPRMPEMLRIVGSDIHPPLTFLVRHAWAAMFGDGDGPQRALSILVASLVIVPIALIGRRCFGPRVALFGCALVALHPVLVPFGQAVDVWPFEWLLTYTALHFALAWFDARRTRDAVGYAVTAALAIYTSYVAGAFLVLLAIVGAFVLRADRRALGAWLALQLAPLLAALPQLATFRTQFAREGSAAFFRFPTAAQVVHLAHTLGYSSFKGVAVGAVLLGLAVARPATRHRALLLLVLATLPLLAKRLWVVILPTDAFVVTPLLLLVAAAGLSQLPWRSLRRLGALAALLLAARTAWQLAPSPEAASSAGAIAFVRAEAHPGDVVVHAESHTLLFFARHAPELRSRLLLRNGERVHYAEGGLVIPDSMLWREADLEAARRAGVRLWCVGEDRAAVRSGVASRAGAWATSRFHSAAPFAAWHRGPVEVRVVPGASAAGASAMDTAGARRNGRS